jgi:hypothetical protein
LDPRTLFPKSRKGRSKLDLDLGSYRVKQKASVGCKKKKRKKKKRKREEEEASLRSQKGASLVREESKKQMACTR